MWKQIKVVAMDKFTIIIWYCCWYNEAKYNCYTWNSLIFKTKRKGCKLGYVGAILIHKCKFKLPFAKLFSKFSVFIIYYLNFKLCCNSSLFFNCVPSFVNIFNFFNIHLWHVTCLLLSFLKLLGVLGSFTLGHWIPMW
jgi:hypothetical protein